MIVAILVAATLTVAPAGTEGPPWVEHRSTSEGYSVRFPGEPDGSEQMLDLPVGPTTLRITALDTPSGIRYLVISSNLPPAGPGETLDMAIDGARDGFIKEFENPEILEETPIERDGVAGSDLTVRVTDLPELPGDRRFRVRYFAVPGRLYQVMAVYPAEGTDLADIETFLDSFRLLAPRGDAHEPAAGVPRPFVSENWGFRADFPGRPVVRPSEVPESMREAFKRSEGFVLVGDKITYAITCFEEGTERTPAELKAYLFGLQAGAVGEGKLLSQADIPHGNRTAREFTFEPAHVPGGFMKVRVHVVGGRTYAVTYLESKRGASEGRGDRFLDSFALTGE